METTTNTTQPAIDLSNFTVAEIQAALKEQIAKEKKEKERARKAYEAAKDLFVDTTFNEALSLVKMLTEFKSAVHSAMDEVHAQLQAYGQISAKSQGGFSVFHTNGNFRIKRRRDTVPVWDERASKGVDLIKDFLFDFVKKRDKLMFELLMPFIEKNEKGELEYSRVMLLCQHEDKFDDSRWIEGLKLIKEGYSISLKAYGYEFQFKNANGKWETLNLNFSNI